MEKGKSPHGTGWAIRIRGEERRAELNGFGGQVAYIYPADDLILSAAEFAVRPWRSARVEGVDFQGRTFDGKRWRYVAISVEEIQYGAVTDEEADNLSSHIDDMCFQTLGSS